MGSLAAPVERQSCSAMLLEPHSQTPLHSRPRCSQPLAWPRRAYPVPPAGPTTAEPASHLVPLLDTTCASYSSKTPAFQNHCDIHAFKGFPLLPMNCVGRLQPILASSQTTGTSPQFLYITAGFTSREAAKRGDDRVFYTSSFSQEFPRARPLPIVIFLL